MNPLHQTTAVTVKAFSEVGHTRRVGLSLAQDLQFTEAEAGKVGIVITELANNLVKHGDGGTILMRVVKAEETSGIEILSVDTGGGMEDVSQCMQDGYSTAGSPGTGLGAIDRLSSGFEIYSQLGKGTILIATLWASPITKKPSPFAVGTVCVPLRGETQSGDGWSVKVYDDKIKILVVDGLGHGAVAAEAADLAIDTFDEKVQQPPLQLMQTLHAALRSTRGAAAAIAEIDLTKNELIFCGVGNISGLIIQGLKTRGMTSYNGIVGHQQIKTKEFTLPFPENAFIVMHSDGLTTRWKLDDYQGLAQRSASLIAGALFRDCSRGRDDSTVLVVRRD